VNDFTDAWFIGYTPSYTAGVWIGYPGMKRTLGNKEAGGVAALPMWIHFMEKFMKGKPNDKFQKSPPPDKEILARRSEAERAIRRVAAEEAETPPIDSIVDQAKSAAKEDEEKKEPGERPIPKMEEPERGLPPRVNREDRSRPETDRNPPPKPAEEKGEKEKKKRGKNG
jgi:penicillin-binding protein 1A